MIRPATILGSAAFVAELSYLSSRIPVNNMIPESRAYVHVRCQSSTEISGPEFSSLSDPLVGMIRTYCAGCDEMFPLDEFMWEDTKERIPAFYARHAARVPPLGRMLGSRQGMFALAGVGALLGLLLGIVIGVLAGWLVGSIMILLGIIGGLLAGVLIQIFVVSPIIAKKWLGVEDLRLLK